MLLIFIFICFDSSQILEEIASLSFQVSWTHQFLTEVKKILYFRIFLLGLSNFGWSAWFPFDKGQSKADILLHLHFLAQTLLLLNTISLWNKKGFVDNLPLIFQEEVIPRAWPLRCWCLSQEPQDNLKPVKARGLLWHLPMCLFQCIIWRVWPCQVRMPINFRTFVKRGFEATIFIILMGTGVTKICLKMHEFHSLISQKWKKPILAPLNRRKLIFH